MLMKQVRFFKSIKAVNFERLHKIDWNVVYVLESMFLWNVIKIIIIFVYLVSISL